jgi:hypothetical protein
VLWPGGGRRPKPEPDPAPADASAYERLREQAEHGGARRGLAVLAAKGLAAFLKIAAHFVAAPPSALASTAASAGAVTGAQGQLVRILAGMVLAHAP